MVGGSVSGGSVVVLMTSLLVTAVVGGSVSGTEVETSAIGMAPVVGVSVDAAVVGPIV